MVRSLRVRMDLFTITAVHKFGIADQTMVSNSVQFMNISRNNLKCNCPNLLALRNLKGRVKTFDIDTVMKKK